ncbi:glycosyltransferase family 4 protein [Pelagibius marinus]|uniref:glycosyltransferase family 4 protein n=1 Tax=Pelagibius marinus TaxID=2762760 RepID=UPI0029CA5BC2|nr:glycosyltransferase family 4 protein [Pelagibius marinus]
MTSPSGGGNLRILTFTTLYPNTERPQYSVFVENRLRQLVASGEVSARVLAPVPYFPFRSRRFGTYASFARTPLHEARFGLEIDHPRYLAIPKVGMSMAPYLLYDCARRALGRLQKEGRRFDLIDAHYLYPDGVAAVMLGRTAGLPVTVTARGTDVNLLPDFFLPRRLIRQAARRADGVIAVSSALAERLARLGVDRSRITVLRNGIDPTVFRPRTPYRRAGQPPPRPLVVSVGNLVPLKGHDLAISALAEIPGLTLWIVGTGPERGRLELLARDLTVADRVSFLGSVPHKRMPEVYSAADLLLLASEREGWPNVLLEAMACGTRVVTTRVSDVAEIVNSPIAGICLSERRADCLARAIRRLLAAPVPCAQTRAHALNFTWDATTAGQIALFREILNRRHSDGC